MDDKGTIERFGATARLRPIASGAIEEAYTASDGDEVKGGAAILDTIAMFGIEIINMPESDGWLKRLRLLEKRGHIDLSKYDLDNDIEREFVFVRYVFMTAADILSIGEMIGAQRQDMKKALELL